MTKQTKQKKLTKELSEKIRLEFVKDHRQKVGNNNKTDSMLITWQNLMKQGKKNL